MASTAGSGVPSSIPSSTALSSIGSSAVLTSSGSATPLAVGSSPSPSSSSLLTTNSNGNGTDATKKLSPDGAPSSSAHKVSAEDQEQTVWDMNTKQLQEWLLTTKIAWIKKDQAPPKNGDTTTAVADKEPSSSSGRAEQKLQAPKELPLPLVNLLASLDACNEQEELLPVMKDDDEGDERNGSNNKNNINNSINSNKSKDDKHDDDDDENDDDDQGGPKKKKRKKGGPQIPKKPVTRRRLLDPFRIWTPAWKERKDDDGNIIINTTIGDEGNSIVLAIEEDTVPVLTGGKLAQLDVKGLINALSHISGGLLHDQQHGDNNSNINNYAATKELARSIHRVVSARVHRDILRTTPGRILDLVSPELTMPELNAIRRRIYDTVVLGKGQRAEGAEDEETAHLATSSAAANAQMVHEIEKFKKCGDCGNVDQATFVLDRKNGDVICSNCGTVVSESITHEGTQYRKFEGEVDRNHNGDAANPLYSNAYNMSTTLGGVNQVSGAGMGGWGSGGGGGGMGGGKRNLETILRNAHAYIELNVSQFGKTDRRTRTGYKDKQKKDAFLNMNHVGDALSLHEAVVQRAKELFAGFRDDRELVQQYKGVIAACLCEAFEQLSQEGKAILKKDEQAEAEEQEAAAEAAAAAGVVVVGPISARAARRNELHHANMAGKGGILLDFSEMQKKDRKIAAAAEGAAAAAAAGSSSNGGGGGGNGNSNSPSKAAGAIGQQPLAEKPAASWDLEDCRSWLLDASRRIAQQWVDERNKASVEVARKIPSGTVDDLEGRLVEHSIHLCEQLELELKSRSTGSSAADSNNGNKNGKINRSTSHSTRRVVTPRVQDMSKLRINWQGKHERGKSGSGAGAAAGAANGAGCGRSAGQILFLKTAKKLGAMLNGDSVAGEAFHKELRGIINHQETRKRQVILEEASRRRFQQMKRKPWLQARLQEGATK